MTRKKRFWITCLVLACFAALPLLFLNAWSIYEKQKADSLLIPLEKPAGQNLYDLPLWKQYIDEKKAYDEAVSKIEFIPDGPPNILGAVSGHYASELPPEPTNALALWSKLNQEINAILVDHKMDPELKKMNPRPGSIASRERKPFYPLGDILETANQKVKSPDSTNQVAMYPDLAPFYSNFVQTVGTSEAYQNWTPDQQVAALSLAYSNAKDTIWPQIKSSLAAGHYLGENLAQSSKERESVIIDFSPNIQLKSYALYSEVRADWNARLGRRTETVSELETLLDLSAMETHHGTMMSELIRAACQNMAQSTLHNVMLENILNEEDLLHIQRRLENINSVEYFRNCLVGEQFFAVALFEGPNTETGQSSNLFKKGIRTLFEISGIPRLNQANYIQTLSSLRECFDSETQTVNLDIYNKLIHPKTSLSNYLYTKQLLLGMKNTHQLVLRNLSRRDVAILACALERYCLKNAHYPETLAELVPNFIAAMPPGSKEQGALTYKTEGEGYELVSNKIPSLPGNTNMEVIWRR